MIQTLCFISNDYESHVSKENLISKTTMTRQLATRESLKSLVNHSFKGIFHIISCFYHVKYDFFKPIFFMISYLLFYIKKIPLTFEQQNVLWF